MTDQTQDSTEQATVTNGHRFRAPREALVAPGEMDCHAADMTATIAADVPLKKVQQRLAKLDQWLPIDGNPDLPVGQLVETNSSGPLRLGYGAWRDLLLGCQFRAGTVELITAGGRTVKNVAGYDLTKLMVGQRGIFGQIVTITARTYKRPALALVADFAPSDRFIERIVATPLRPQWAMLSPQSLRCGWLGEEPAIELFEKLLGPHQPISQSRRKPAEDIVERASLWKTDGDCLRAAVPPIEILAFAKQAKLSQWIADAAFGIVLCSLADIDREAVAGAAATVGGSVTFFSDGQPQWRPSDVQTRLLAELKKAFDPDGKGPALTLSSP